MLHNLTIITIFKCTKVTICIYTSLFIIALNVLNYQNISWYIDHINVKKQ